MLSCNFAGDRHCPNRGCVDINEDCDEVGPPLVRCDDEHTFDVSEPTFQSTNYISNTKYPANAICVYTFTTAAQYYIKILVSDSCLLD